MTFDQKKKLLNMECILIFCTTCVKHFSLQELSEIRSQMCTSLHIKHPLLLTEFNET